MQLENDQRTESSQKSNAEASDKDSTPVSTLNLSGDDSQGLGTKQKTVAEKEQSEKTNPITKPPGDQDFHLKGPLGDVYAVPNREVNRSRVHQSQTVASNQNAPKTELQTPKPPIMHSSEKTSGATISKQPEYVVKPESPYESIDENLFNKSTRGRIPSVSEAQQNGSNPLIKQSDVHTFPSAPNNPQTLSHVASQHLSQTHQRVPQPSFNASVSPPIASLDLNVPQPKPRNNKGQLI